MMMQCTKFNRVHHSPSLYVRLLLNNEFNSHFFQFVISNMVIFVISNTRPFGDAVLDGVNFDIEGDGRGDPENYAVLAKKLAELSNQAGRQFYLTAAPQCPLPDKYHNAALSTGLFDSVFVQFYNNGQCQFDSGNFQSSWNQWTNSINARKFYVGLPAAPEGGSGYVAPETVINQVLPSVKNSAKYGGVMVWNRDLDNKNGFSAKIHDSVVN